MALNLYRRHSANCPGGRAPYESTYESDEARRGWKNCWCPIYASGTLQGRFKRRNTERSAWPDAKAVSGFWETAGSWDPEAAPPLQVPVTVDQAPGPTRTTIERAIAAFLAEHAGSSAPNTQKKYAHLLRKIQQHSDTKGYVLVEQWGPMDVREFRASWTVSPLTASKNMTVIRSFFEFAFQNEWIIRNPARLVKEKRGRVDTGPKERLPFSDEELTRMFQACETQYGKTPIRWSRDTHKHPAPAGETANYRYSKTGQDLADFISVSVYTGLRISDVATFHLDRLRAGGECWVRTTKSGRKVYTWLPEWLQERVRLRAGECGPLIFGEHQTKDLNVVTDVWRRKLKRLWSLCGPWPEKPTPHRFRHTFARILLQREGVSVRDVAELLGDTEEMVRKHYAAWVPERQARLTKILREAFEEKPRPDNR